MSVFASMLIHQWLMVEIVFETLCYNLTCYYVLYNSPTQTFDLLTAHPEEMTPSSSSLALVPSFPDIDPSDKIKLGQVAGVDTDSQGNVYIFHRGPVVWNDE